MSSMAYSGGVESQVFFRQLSGEQIGFLQHQGWSSGLIKTLAHEGGRYPLRIWVIDNGTSMQIRDAHILEFLPNTATIKRRDHCSRWEEAKDAVLYASQMAARMHLPTRFVLVNSSGPAGAPSFFNIDQDPVRELQQAYAIMNQAQPNGTFPIAAHVWKFREVVAQVAPELQSHGQKVTLVLAIDGVPTDENGLGGAAVEAEFLRALGGLAGLPVAVIVRLCTDDERVVDFYNGIDLRADLPFYYDVLDDFFGEALEVYLKNPWLNYAYPLHRFRELGICLRALDEMDENLLGLDQVYQLCAILFEHGTSLPNPSFDWLGFLRGVHTLVARERIHYNPISRQVEPWVDIYKMHLIYGGGTPFPSDLKSSSPSPPVFSTPPVEPPKNPRPAAEYVIPPSGVNVPFEASPPAVKTIPSARTIKEFVMKQWAAGEDRGTLRPVEQLLMSVQETFPPAFGLKNHEYFDKFQPFSKEALLMESPRKPAILKRAVRKLRFFLHPDRLDPSLAEEHRILCRTLWDILTDAWDAYCSENDT